MTHSFEPFEDIVDSPLYPRSFPTVFQAAPERLITDDVDPNPDVNNDLDQIKRLLERRFQFCGSTAREAAGIGWRVHRSPRGLSDDEYKNRRREGEQMVENELLEVSEEAGRFFEDGEKTRNLTTGEYAKESKGQDITKAGNASLNAKMTAEAELPPTASASTQPKAENDFPNSYEECKLDITEMKQFDASEGPLFAWV